MVFYNDKREAGTKKSPLYKQKAVVKISMRKSCRGRDRTSTEQLVVAQSSVVDPGRLIIANQPALCYIYPVTSTPETRGYVCQDFITPQSLKNLKSCRGRDRTSTEQLVVAQSSVVDPGRHALQRNGSMLYLSCYLHPRDERACLPKISSLHSMLFKEQLQCKSRVITVFIANFRMIILKLLIIFN